MLSMVVQIKHLDACETRRKLASLAATPPWQVQNENTAKDMDRYIQSANGTSAKEKIKLFKIIWELTGSEFAGRHQQYEMFYGGAPFVAKNYSFMNYGFDEALELVKQCMAGYDF